MGRLGTLAPRLRVLDARAARPPVKTADRELLTAAHRAWRLAVLQRAHWRCQVCGAQGGRGGVRLYADHVVERQDGGAALDVTNGCALCAGCHSRKSVRERAKRLSAPSIDTTDPS